jgi:hypothetical protein
MPNLDLNKYGIPLILELSIELREYPATDIEPTEAPIVLLIDENHLAQPAIDHSANIAAEFLQQFPEAPVVLEHFLAGETVPADQLGRHGGSDFHMKLCQSVNAELLGGDDHDGLMRMDEITEDYEVRISEYLFDNRQLPEEERARETAHLKEESRLAIRNDPIQVIRSRSLIETSLQHLNINNRIGLLNCGLNHNNHIIDNVLDEDSQPVCSRRKAINFIRIRPTKQLRQLSAYYHWRDRGEPHGEDLVDWSWAEENVPGLN